MSILQVMWLIVAATTTVCLIVASVKLVHKDGREARFRKLIGMAAVAGIVLYGAGVATFAKPQVKHLPAIPVALRKGALSFHFATGASATDPLGSSQPLALSNSGRTGKIVFTFDDGPDVYTPAIVTELQELHIRAIFFTIGKKVTQHQEIVRQEADAGDLIGNHTWDHHSLDGKGTGTRPLSPAEVRSELSRTSSAIRAAGGGSPTLWRPPYGAVTPQDARIASSLGMRLVMDSSFDNSITDSEDWSGHQAPAIARLVEAHIRSGSKIIAFHDGIGTAPNTIAALPLIVQWMNTHGYMSTLNLPRNTTGGWLTPQGQANQNAKGTGSA